MSGYDVCSDRRVELPPQAGSLHDSFDEHFREEVRVPDPERVSRYWEMLRARSSFGGRLVCGVPLDQALEPRYRDQIDLVSLAAVFLRAKWRASWTGNVAQLTALRRGTLGPLGGIDANRRGIAPDSGATRGRSPAR
jgi:hypothetical protein